MVQAIGGLSVTPTHTFNGLFRRGRVIIVTDNGKPAYIMLGVDGAAFEGPLIDPRHVRAKRTLSRMQRTSADLGNDSLTLDEINAEIAAERSASM